MTEILTGEPGWYVPTGAIHCPRCGDHNWDTATRLCYTCTNGEPPLWEDGQYRRMPIPDDEARRWVKWADNVLDTRLYDWQIEILVRAYTTPGRLFTITGPE